MTYKKIFLQLIQPVTFGGKNRKTCLLIWSVFDHGGVEMKKLNPLKELMLVSFALPKCYFIKYLSVIIDTKLSKSSLLPLLESFAWNGAIYVACYILPGNFQLFVIALPNQRFNNTIFSMDRDTSQEQVKLLAYRQSQKAIFFPQKIRSPQFRFWESYTEIVLDFHFFDVFFFAN